MITEPDKILRNYSITKRQSMRTNTCQDEIYEVYGKARSTIISKRNSQDFGASNKEKMFKFKQERLNLFRQSQGETVQQQQKINQIVISNEDQFKKLQNFVTQVDKKLYLPKQIGWSYKVKRKGRQTLVSNYNNSLLSNKNDEQVEKDENTSGTELSIREQIEKVTYYIGKMNTFLKKNNTDHPQYQLFTDHFIQNLHSIYFSQQLSPSCDFKVIRQKQQIIKPRTKCKLNTVIFDLDETLIHCNDNPSILSDVYLPVVFPNGERVEAGINIRPFAVFILQELSKLCEVIIFTASHECYAQQIIDYLDPKGQFVSQRLFRDSCILTQQLVHVKDLRVLCVDRSLKDLVLIDNATYSFCYQMDNGVPIVPYFDDKNDTELLDLFEYLKILIQSDDMREINRRYFKMHRLIDCQSFEHAVEKISKP